MNERIKTLRKEYLNLTLEKFGERIGVKKNTLSNIENGNRSVTDQMFKSICREFHVNEEWLRTGTGEWEATTPDSALDQLRLEYNLDELEYSIITEYFKLSDEDRKIFRDYFKSVFENLTEEGTDAGDTPEKELILRE